MKCEGTWESRTHIPDQNFGIPQSAVPDMMPEMGGRASIYRTFECRRHSTVWVIRLRETRAAVCSKTHMNVLRKKRLQTFLEQTPAFPGADRMKATLDLEVTSACFSTSSESGECIEKSDLTKKENQREISVVLECRVVCTAHFDEAIRTSRYSVPRAKRRKFFNDVTRGRDSEELI